ncbi:MAG: hypothetical protein J6Y55_03910 [Bacteroidales bacterium]|nr:hypothetical protein [Bacteroidales bacterium]
MKRLVLFLACTLTLAASSFAQKELTISGGNTVSAMVCENSVLYVWGINTKGQLGLGHKNAVNTPTEVTFFSQEGLYIQQVNCGSGAHFVALDCSGKVWCWGNNSLGQCGTGNIPNSDGVVQETPVQVKLGTSPLAGTEYDCSGYLCNVDVVYAGNNNTFAILGDGQYKGCLVGWGGNSKGFDGQGYDDAYGQLGCGNQVNQPYPVFVQTPNKKPLQGVVQIYAGDNCAYALVDPDGDGVGTVYSWGHEHGEGQLGRAQNGGAGSPGKKTDPYARPVAHADGSPLDNITFLGCGDGEGYGLDVDGYIWAWGNGAWNNAAGVLDANYSWYADGASYSTPLRVRKGLTTGASNDGTYLLAKWVAGGQGYGMAITADNKPVAWGGGGCGDGGGGATGSKVGQSADKAGAEYIKYSNSGVHSNVVLINRGDTWGFYGLDNGDIYAWGCNEYGQLGVGGTQPKSVATKINPPANCNPREPNPTVDLTPGDMTVCASAFNGQELNSGFLIDTKLASHYKITWYKDGEVITSASGLISAKGTKYKATEPGTYKVMIEHVESGTGSGCVKYDPAIAEMTIAAYPQTFTVPDEIIYCAEKGEIPQIGVTTTNNRAIYSWYASESARTPIATTVGSETKEADFSSITLNNGKGYVYVEETSSSSGTFIPQRTMQWTSNADYMNAGTFNNMYATGFTVKEPVTITACDFNVNAWVYNTGTEGIGTVTFTIYGSTYNNGGYIANTSARKGTLTAKCSVTGTNQNAFNVYTAEGSVTLDPGLYFITMTQYAKSGADMGFKVGRGSSNISTNTVDDATGNILQYTTMANGNNPNQQGCGGHAFNIKFQTKQGFCDRIKIPISEECPCTQPKAVTITSADADGYLCPGDKSMLTPTAQANARDFTYTWYKGSEADANIVAGPSKTDQLTFEADEAETYIVKVVDALMPNSKCKATATVTLNAADNPTVKLGKGADYCVGDNVSDITLTFTGNAPFEYSYTENGGTANSATANGTSATITPKNVVSPNSAYTTYEYAIASLSDKYCPAVASGYAGSSTVTIVAIPSASIDASDESVCEPNTITLTGSSDISAATLAWGGDGSGSAATQTASGAKVYNYTLTATNQAGTKSCVSEVAEKSVTIFAKPTVTVAAPVTQICAGNDLTVDATAKVGNTTATGGEYAWNGATGDGSSVSLTKDATWPNPETVDVSVVYTSEDGCVSDESNKVTLTFDPKPDAPVAVPTISYCTTADPSTVKPLEVTIANGATTTWYLPNGSTSATAPTPSIASAGETEYFVTQTKAGCESDKTKITVVVNAELQPSFIMSDEEICENTSATLTLGQADTYTSIEWTGDATQYFNATKIANPTFSGADVTASQTYPFSVKVADKNGCTGHVEGEITVHPVPTATLATPNNEHCITETTAQVITATVEPSMAGTGTWSTNVVKTGETTATFTPSDNEAGSYTVTYDFESDKGCKTERTAEQIMIVNALPTPSFTLSNTSVCVSGNNSDPITVTKTNPTTGTFEYSIDKGSIADNGTFTPTEGSEGVYTVTLTYTDAKGCVQTTTNSFVVHALPTVEINPITKDEICYNSAAVDLTTTVYSTDEEGQLTTTPATGGTEVWAGAISSKTFDPSRLAVGENQMTYTYTDAYKCQNVDDYTITIKKPKIPTAGADVNEMVNSLHVLEGDETLTASSNENTDGTGLQWMPYTGGSVLQDGGTSFVVADVKNAKTGNDDGLVGSYPFAVRQMITVADKGCYSDSVIVTLNVSKCNAMAPSVNFADRYICESETESNIANNFLEGTRTEGDNPPADYRIAWLTENPVGKNASQVNSMGWEISGSSVNAPGAAAVPYKPTKETKDYYVAEYSIDEDCWSVGTKVTVHVVPNPVVTVTSEPNVCKIGNEAIQVSISPVATAPAVGSLTASSGSLNGTTWTPGDYDGDNLPVEFTYTYTTEPYSDGVTCSSTEKSNTVAHFMKAPDSQEYTWLINDIANIPNDYVKGELSSTGETMKWYADELMNSKLNEGTTLTLNKDDLQAQANGQLTLTEVFWINQVDAFGCESAPADVVLRLVDCPWEAPKIDPVAACLGKPLDNLSAEEGASVALRAESGVTKWIWYKEGVKMTESASLLAIPDIVSNSVAGVTNFEVQYEAVESQSKKACLSPKSSVTVTVYPLPVIELEEKETACYSTEEVLITVNASSENGTGIGEWSIEGDASALKANSNSAVFYPQANGTKSGDYKVTYTYTDEKSCQSSKTHDIEVIYLPAPETISFYAIVTQENPVEIGAVKTDGDGIAWYEYAASTDEEDKLAFTAGSTANMYQTNDSPNVLANKKYYARQYKAGTNNSAMVCYSESTPAEVVIKICPVPHVEIANVDSCVYNGNPTLTAIPGEWMDKDNARNIAKTTYRFYESANGKDYTTFVNGTTNTETGNGTYTPNLAPDSDPSHAGFYYYFVSEWNDEPYTNLTHPEGCESSPVKVAVNMKATTSPKILAVTAPAICDGDENPQFRIASEDATSRIYWFEYADDSEVATPNDGSKIDTLSAYGKGATYQPINAIVGTNKVYAAQYIGGCFSPLTYETFVVKPNPAAPDSIPNKICYQEASNDNRVIEAVGSETEEYSITWFSDARKSKTLKVNSNTYQPADTTVGVYLYYAMQTVNGCNSPLTPISFEVKPLPFAPRISPQDRLCTYDEAPILHAEGTDITWYASDKITKLNEGEPNNDYQTVDITAGKKQYYATQTVNGCEGPAGYITYMVNKQPEKPNVLGGNMCQGDTANVPILSTDLLLDKWYADEDLTMPIASGYTYEPEVGVNEFGNKLYYVIREQNGCFSEVAIDTLFIIKHPVITIDEDRTICVYDTIHSIQVQTFEPELTDRSSVVWRVRNGKVSKFVEEDPEEHSITPVDEINAAGEYEVFASYRYVYDNIFCTSDEVSMNVSVKERARKPIVFTTTICAGENIEQLRSLGSPYTTWISIGDENRRTLPLEYHGQSYKFQPGQSLDTGIYHYVVYDMNMYDEENLLGCESLRDTVSMVVAPAAKTKLFGRDSVCMGSIGESYYTQYEKTSQYFWNVTGNHLNYSKDASSTSVRYIDWLEVGIDTLTVYEQTWAGCEGFDTIIVRIAPEPIASFGWSMPGSSNVIELVDSTIQDSLWTTDAEGNLVAEPIAYTLEWCYGHQGAENQVDTVVPFDKRKFPIREGGYLYGYNCPILTVTNDFGCKSSYTECIFVNVSSSLYVPDAFAPTNPAHAVRTFAPKGFNLLTCEISVYDKWGNLLWFSNEVKDGMFVGYWDGRYDGKMMKSDMYIWKMEATFLDGQVWPGFDNGNGKTTKYGSVMLLR